MPASRRTVALVALAAFAAAFAGSWALHRKSALYDTDAYYHLAVARAYAEEGVVDELPQLRFSLLGDGFGDKELAFHLFLVPFVAAFEPLVAGRLALAFLNALAAAAVAALAARILGWWGLAVPFWLFYASTEFAWRAVRLRPELLSLVLLLAAAAAAGWRRDRLLGLVALLYAWSYTAFQALLGLAALWFAYFGLSRRRWPWRMLAYAFLGAGLALVLHPHFPHNLEIWAAQNVEFFLRKGELGVGTEIRPNFTDVVLMVNLGWFLGLAVLAASARSPAAARPAAAAEGRLAAALAIAAAAFGGLYLLMSRFSVYFFPFATLGWLYELHRRGRRPGAWTYLPARGRIPLALAAAVCLVASFPEARRQLGVYAHRTRLGTNEARLADREALAAAIPEGARVAADWGPTATLMLWAPQGRYLNALDPVFMAIPFPEEQRLLEEVLAGREPDVPAAVAGALASDHLVYPTIGHERLDERLRGDPRVEVLHRGTLTLVRFRAAAAFAVDWHLVPAGAEAFDPGADVAAWPPSPRAADPRVRALEGYVDAARARPEAPCVGFVRQVDLGAPALIEAAVAPYGPTSLWLDGRLLLAVADELAAVPRRGVRLPLPLAPGRHRVMVYTCEGSVAQRKGFYWREESPQEK